MYSLCKQCLAETELDFVVCDSGNSDVIFTDNREIGAWCPEQQEWQLLRMTSSLSGIPLWRHMFTTAVQEVWSRRFSESSDFKQLIIHPKHK